MNCPTAFLWYDWADQLDDIGDSTMGNMTMTEGAEPLAFHVPLVSVGDAMPNLQNILGCMEVIGLLPLLYGLLTLTIVLTVVTMAWRLIPR